MKFSGTIRAVLERTRDIKSLQIERPKEFDFIPGQYLLVSVSAEGKVFTKPLSISSSPTEDLIEVTETHGA